MALSLAVEEANIFRPGTPVELQLRQGLAWHTRLLTKPRRQTMLGPIIRHNSGRSNRMSQPEPLFRRFNITPLLRNRQANAPVISYLNPTNDAPEQSKRLSLANLRTEDCR